MPRFSTEPAMTKEDCLEKLSHILDGIFQAERREADAAFLSSGVDSSLIAFGIRAKKTFSVAYEDDVFDESGLAGQAAALLGSEHHVLKISPSDYFGAVREAMKWRRVPTGDASYIALFLAAREAARYTDVICSGEGPDELFCGYPCYSRYFDDPGEDHWLRVNTVMEIVEVPALPDYGGDGFLKMNALDLTYWMQGNILPNVYRAAEGAGLTIRTPYMNPELTAFALSLLAAYKANQTMGKLLFREAAQSWVGREIAWREKKRVPRAGAKMDANRAVQNADHGCARRRHGSKAPCLRSGTDDRRRVLFRRRRRVVEAGLGIVCSDQLV